MVKKKKGMKECPVCKCSLKPENYNGHMRNVHGKTVEDEGVRKSEEYRPKTKRERQESKRTALRRIQLEERQRMMKIAAVVATVLIVVIGVGIYYIVSMKAGLGTDTPAETTNPEEGKIRIQKSDVADGKIHYYIYNDVTYFAHKNPNGNYKTRISECAPCGNQGDDTVPGRGFSLQYDGNIIYCNTCGTTWDTENYIV
ncbi:DUF2318 domain-containing protein, partial [archaeon]|nr:DUF2318 domain-containing protein [archaeon]